MNEISDEALALINEIKAHAEQTRELVHRVRMHIESRPETGPTLTDGHRWASIATTELQQGYMALTRAVAQPVTF